MPVREITLIMTLFHILLLCKKVTIGVCVSATNVTGHQQHCVAVQYVYTTDDDTLLLSSRSHDTEQVNTVPMGIYCFLSRPT